MQNLAIQNSKIQLFDNQEFGTLKIIMINGETWFFGKNIAEVLGYVNPRKAIIDHVFDEDKNTVTIRDGNKGNPNQTIINESGLYALIFGSKLDSAKRFKHWVTSEVLPSIRKTGSYSVQPNNNQMEKLLAEITEMKDSIKEIRRVTTDNYYAIDEQLTNLLDNTESNNEFITEHNEKLETAIDNMTLSTRQQEKIHEAARVRINYLLGGAHSDQYKKSCRIYFINLWNSLKAKFHCGSSWKDLNPCDFENAVNYIGQWEYQG